MAEETAKSKRRLIKKVETVRERVEKAAEGSEAKPRRLRTTTHKASAPFRLIGRFFSRLNRIKVFRIIGYIIVPPYFRNSWHELRQVTWLKLSMSLRLTFAVIIFAVIFGIVIALLDFVLDKLFREVLLK